MISSSGGRALPRLRICSRCRQSLQLQLHQQRSLTTLERSLTQNSQRVSGVSNALSNRVDSRPRNITGGTRSASTSAEPVAGGLKGLRNRSRQQGKIDSGTRPQLILGQSADQPIRARFAPSPTGYLHLGSLRTALFNNVVASASNGGAFILRIEDTDQSRLVADAEERLLQDLSWAGLKWDEGPDKGGPYGPYRQSERLPIYADHANTLLQTGHAYRCFCSSDKLEAQRRQLHEAGKPTIYPGTCRAVPAEESERRAAEGEPHVVRFKGDAFGRPKLKDAIYGPFQKKDLEEDFVLVKTDGFPTYHFANVVDDHLMKITHVIRGEEWLVSTPKHIALYQAFGWEPPTFAHLGLLVNPDGTKLSKRNDSANLSTYQRDGVFPIALLAWLANLGSSFRANAKPPRDVRGVADALTFKFTRGGIKLNFEKLQHFQGKYRDALLWEPVTDTAAAENEKNLINHHILQPLLQDIHSITEHGSTSRSESSPSPPAGWSTASSSLDLVPALTQSNRQGEASHQSQYILDIMTSKPGDFPSPHSLLTQHGYLFWRVPRHVYSSSLAVNPLNETDMAILDALDQTLEDDNLWSSQTGSTDDGSTKRGAVVVQAVRDLLADAAVDADVPTLHNVLRLVAAGNRDVVSMNSARLFTLLGREEWKYRLDRLRECI